MAIKGSLPDRDTVALVGNAFIQGERLRFSGSMPVNDYLAIARDPALTVASKNATIDIVEKKANRPTEAPHKKDISAYLRNVFGNEQPGELGGFTINFGIETDNEAENDCILYILGSADGFITATALLVIHNPEPRFRMHVTDGAHRTRSLLEVFADKNTSPEQKAAIANNGVPVVIVFEDDMDQAHQDFADAAKAKTINNNLRDTFDIRDVVNNKTKTLIKNSVLLRNRVSPTASSLNIGSRSKNGMLYNATALTRFSSELKRYDPPVSFEPAIVAEFWDSLPKYFPLFREQGTDNPEAILKGFLNADIVDSDGKVAARVERGGHFMLKAQFCPIMARVLLEAHIRKIDPQAILAGMAKLNWYLFNDDASLVTYEELQKKGLGLTDEAVATFNPMFNPIVIKTETRFKVSTTSVELDKLWDNICKRIWNDGGSRLVQSEQTQEAAE